MNPLLRVLHVSTADLLGGAERIARNLHREYARRGLLSTMAVGRRITDDPSVFVMPNHQAGGAWRRFWWGCHQRFQPRYGSSGAARAAVRLAHNLAEPLRLLDEWRGFEDFRYPGTRRVMEACPFDPDVIHCHNLHGKYFDLRALAALSRERPVFLTLHDAWLLAGHCAHSLDCDRWRTGCGECPDLSIYPAIRRDATAYNWRTKQRIYADCHLYVATPSRWLADRVAQSMLAPACEEVRVIPNGVDVSIYQPGDKDAARRRLNLPSDSRILLFAGYRPTENRWKDFATLREAFHRVAGNSGVGSVLFLSVGGGSEAEPVAGAQVRHIPFVEDEITMADYYRAADVYVHAAKVDTFPNSVLEALACGAPVVATAVGGISEQIVSLEQRVESSSTDRVAGVSVDAATGILVPPADAEAMAHAVTWLLRRDDVRASLSQNAVADVARRFTLSRQADTYLEWYEQTLKSDVRPPTSP